MEADNLENQLRQKIKSDPHGDDLREHRSSSSLDRRDRESRHSERDYRERDPRHMERDRRERDPRYMERELRDREHGRDRERERMRDSGRERDRERERERERLARREREPSHLERPERVRRDRSPLRSREHERERPRERELDEREMRRLRRGSRSRSNQRQKSRSVTPIHRKQRKLANWDVRPIGYDGMSAEEVKATGHFPLPGQITALKLAGALGGQGSPNGMGYPLPFVQMPHCASGPAAQNMTVIRQTRRLYVGNIPYAIVEAEIAEFFNTAMIQLKLCEPGNPVVSVSINHDKNYAFVEFRTPEEATSAMAFDGVAFRQQSLKIRRPKDYQPPSTNDPNGSQQMGSGFVSSNVADSPDKIFIGGLPLYFTEDQIVELLSAFGELKSFNLVKDLVTNTSKGFAFCEYLDPEATDNACKGLNNMEIGDKKLLMQRASVGCLKAPGMPGSLTSSVGGPGSVSFFQSGQTTMEPSPILLFLNMVTKEELEDESEYNEILSEVDEECKKFGDVLEIRIPRGDQIKEDEIGKIFVRFSNQEMAGKALRAIAGRKFAERTVLGSYYPVEKFENGEL